jgi:hypothetical protein
VQRLELSTHEDRATLAAQLLASPEVEQDMVAAAYLQYLHRQADPAGLSAGYLISSKACPTKP